jgi:hypothetical protein
MIDSLEAGTTFYFSTFAELPHELAQILQCCITILLTELKVVTDASFAFSVAFVCGWPIPSPGTPHPHPTTMLCSIPHIEGHEAH